jgi:hypothetical protein
VRRATRSTPTTRGASLAVESWDLLAHSFSLCSLGLGKGKWDKFHFFPVHPIAQRLTQAYLVSSMRLYLFAQVPLLTTSLLGSSDSIQRVCVPPGVTNSRFSPSSSQVPSAVSVWSAAPG